MASYTRENWNEGLGYGDEKGLMSNHFLFLAGREQMMAGTSFIRVYARVLVVLTNGRMLSEGGDWRPSWRPG